MGQKELKGNYPNIYSYHDFREYLRDWIEHKKNIDPNFSVRSLARSSGVSPGYIPLILSGKRTLTEKSARKLVPSLNLSKSEQKYFEYIRQISESTSPDKKIEALKNIKKSKAYKNKEVDDLDSYKYLSNSLNVVIREMSAINGFQLDAKWIQDRLKTKVPISEINESIAFLLDNEILRLNRADEVEKPDHEVRCTGGVYKLSMSQFHAQMLEKAITSIYETPSDERNLVSQTIAINASDFNKIQDIMDEALEKIQNVAKQSDGASEVYYITHLAFPLSKVSGAKDV